MEKIVPIMTPATGSRLKRFVGDSVRFELRAHASAALPRGWRAILRTNLGRAETLRREILRAHTTGLPAAGESWRDLPMVEQGRGGPDRSEGHEHVWHLDLPLTEVGYFKAKAYLVDSRGWQHWPEGADAGICVHPDRYRTGNTIYCAWPRLFGASRTRLETGDQEFEPAIAPLDSLGFAILPPSGKLRDLTEQIPHIVDRLGCRILHLLPVNPTPTTYARFGRFGSPYAALDLTAIDPALVVFDKRTTGIDQFRELTFAAHSRGARVFLDIVINHTGWGSMLQENHPEWFLRNADGTFASPGAWGNTWEDLVELKHVNVELWDELAQMFLTWCRRGVDGFRCDAGYKVPVAAWQYIVARVQQEFPEALFLLEGLGGAWDATETLLTEGGMQWAYSELFQNYSGADVAWYLDHSFRKSEESGLLVHYSETHDNDRLARRGRVWSLLRNRLCALASVSGGFGFTGGVEWLASEKIKVHGCTGLAWDSQQSIVPELAQLNLLVSNHPCFFEGAEITRITAKDSPVLGLRRVAAAASMAAGQEVPDEVFVLANLDAEQSHSPVWESQGPLEIGRACVDLLTGEPPPFGGGSGGIARLTLAPGAVHCLGTSLHPRGLEGPEYRRVQSTRAWATQAAGAILPQEIMGEIDLPQLGVLAQKNPAGFLTALLQIASDHREGVHDFGKTLAAILEVPGRSYSAVVHWALPDRHRVTLVPPNHWLMVEDATPFRAALKTGDGELTVNRESIEVRPGQNLAYFEPRKNPCEAVLSLERYGAVDRQVDAPIRFLPALESAMEAAQQPVRPDDLALLTNGRGGMARLRVDLGRICSKYDCVLGANLHADLPVDRHVFVKRVRVWVNADGFISPLDFRSLAHFQAGSPAVWNFVANAGDGRTVEIQVSAAMLENRNSTLLRFVRPSVAQASGKQLPAHADVRLTVRLDIEDRGFHSETRRNGGAEHHFAAHTKTLAAAVHHQGFAFAPSADRQLRVFTNAGEYNPAPEWSEGIPHPVEQTRGQPGSGDAYSPGWFELPLPKGAGIDLVITADSEDPTREDIDKAHLPAALSSESPASPAKSATLLGPLLRAAQAFVVRRGEGKTVIAGYPWFLDWGRDTFIAARGLLAAGMIEEVRQIVVTFAKFEDRGTLPNTIFGSDASNRDTSDAPLWFAVVCEELSAVETRHKPALSLYDTPVGPGGRTVREVLLSIATHCIQGTPNGIRMDPASGLLFSPSHFTWMDTNHPAGTPREGYPVEIQALWIRLLRQLHTLCVPHGCDSWKDLAQRALKSVEDRFWLEEHGWFGDVLLARPGQPASEAIRDDALRSNCCFLVSLGLVTGSRAQRCLEAVRRHLVVPGALRSLAPLPVSVPLPISGPGGHLLNNPLEPYWGRYEGDEDTRRKPAYHNGTAWTWTFPVFCEALARAWENSPAASSAAGAYLGSMASLMISGCLGQLPEIIDGDAPHTQRGCDAQAWSATEALRVLKLLSRKD